MAETYLYRFGNAPAYELNTRERCLLADGTVVPLGSRALDILVVLVERAGTVVSRRDLVERVWPEKDVEENNLNVQVSALRKVLGAGLIATIPGRGYCFTPHAVANEASEVGEQHLRFRTNLPASLTPLIGRERELVEIGKLTASHRLVTLIGPGGIGKTLLAQHLLKRAEGRFRHGVCFVDLSGLRDVADIPGAIASALQIQPRPGVALAGLAAAMEPLEVLVMLDNAEVLLAGAAQVALALHESSPGLTLLVTSQAPLKLASEQVYRVGALALPDGHLPPDQAMRYGAIELFVERARAADSRFELTEDAAAVVIDICRALEGLPLAIELAAWRAPALGVRHLADSLHEPLKLLAVPHLHVPKRFQTLRHALEWSYGLLDLREQIVLRRMSILVGSSDLALIQQVACDDPRDGPIDEWGVVDALSTLVERSLVAVVVASNATVRYRLLEAPKSFAREQLIECSELEKVSRRHGQAMSDRFLKAFEERFSGRQRLVDWHDRHLHDVDNGNAALAWLLQSGEDGLVSAMLPGLMHATAREETGKHADMAHLATELADRAPASRYVVWALAEASIFIMNPDPRRGQELSDRAIVLARQWVHLFEDGRWLYRALCQRAIACFNLAQTDAGQASLCEARAMEQTAWPAVFRVQRWAAEVWLADRLGDGNAMYLGSRRLHRLSREAGQAPWASGLNLINGALAGGRAPEAVDAGLSVLAQLEGTRHFGFLAETRLQMVGALIECGRLEEARLQSQAAWPLVTRFARPDAWADYQALLLALEDRPFESALLQGYANQLCAREQIVRTRNEAAAVNRTRRILLESLGEEELNRLLVKGEDLLDDDIPGIAFG